MLHQIQHRNSEKYNFPGQSFSTGRSQPPTPPTDAEIKAALTRAEVNASVILEKLGLLKAEQSFEFSLIARGDRNWEKLIVSDSESDSEDDIDEAGQQVYEARDLFSNFTGRIELPHSTSDKHIYLIRDDNGKVCHVKKNSVVWMLTASKAQETSARMIRFKQSRPQKPKPS